MNEASVITPATVTVATVTTPTTQSKKVLACPNCRKKVVSRHNLHSYGWQCYFCKTKFPQPFQRSADYFTRAIGFKKKKIPMTDANNNVIKGEFTYVENPIKRRNRRLFTDSDIIPREKILSMLFDRYGKNPYILKKKDIRNAAFLSFLFLTGARVEEVIGVPFFGADGKRVKGKWEIEPVKKYQINKLLYKKRNIVVWEVENMPILKRRMDDKFDSVTNEIKRVTPTRKISLPIEYEKEFIEYIDKWLIRLKDEDIVFKFGLVNAWRICYAFYRTYNHMWRHLRASDLAKTYSFQSLQLKHFFGWATESMAQRYTHLTTDTLIDSMIIGKENQGIKLPTETEPKAEQEQKV